MMAKSPLRSASTQTVLYKKMTIPFVSLDNVGFCSARVPVKIKMYVFYALFSVFDDISLVISACTVLLNQAKRENTASANKTAEKNERAPKKTSLARRRR